MKQGKKRVAITTLRKTLNHINLQMKINPLKILYEAIDNIIPHIETRHTKIGGVSYQIPIDVSADRRLGLALR